MARAFVAFYMGDYQKKTQHLDTLHHGAYFLLLQHCWTHGAIPLEPAARAAIARMTPQQWRKVAPAINVFFDAEGRNKRATEEVEKAERVSLKRAMAGQKGGFASGISKSKQIGSRPIANPKQLLQQEVQQRPSISIPIQNSKITTSFSDAARESATSQLVASLDRVQTAARTGHPPGRPCWVVQGTPEWAAHEHNRRARAWKPPVAERRVVEGIEQLGCWFETTVPPGYDEATGERLPGKAEDAA